MHYGGRLFIIKSSLDKIFIANLVILCLFYCWRCVEEVLVGLGAVLWLLHLEGVVFHEVLDGCSDLVGAAWVYRSQSLVEHPGVVWKLSLLNRDLHSHCRGAHGCDRWAINLSCVTHLLILQLHLVVTLRCLVACVSVHVSDLLVNYVNFDRL